MKRIALIVILLTSATIMAQNTDEKTPSKDLWTLSIDVNLGDDWKQKTIAIPGKDTPNVMDFFRALAKAYPCEYHDLLLQALDGDKEVLFNHKRPVISIDKDSCLLENGNFAMRVFYENDKPAALGVCCLKAITTDLQEAYYYRYNAKTRKLIPLVKGSDFTGGILKRRTVFDHWREEQTALMTNSWGRCGITSSLVWNKGKFEFKDVAEEDFQMPGKYDNVNSLLSEIIYRYGMELRYPEEPLEPGMTGGYMSLPICIVIINHESGSNYIDASAMEGFYYFHARAWDRTDGQKLVAVYTACAPKFDYDFKRDEDDRLYKTPHKLKEGDEVILHFYLCEDSGKVSYLSPSSANFATVVGKGIPNLERNEWRCVLSPDDEDLVFVRESDGERKVYQWKDNALELKQ